MTKKDLVKIRNIDLRIPEHSYFFGFAQTDGTLGRTLKNKGRF